jgi:hypothetical protein
LLLVWTQSAEFWVPTSYENENCSPSVYSFSHCDR